jgi:hypothetical protein
MPRPRLSPAWLSQDMAHALAAMCPPLTAPDIVHAANRLMAHARSTEVLGHLLRSGADLMRARRIVEALRALRDLHH